MTARMEISAQDRCPDISHWRDPNYRIVEKVSEFRCEREIGHPGKHRVHAHQGLEWWDDGNRALAALGERDDSLPSRPNMP